MYKEKLREYLEKSFIGGRINERTIILMTEKLDKMSELSCCRMVYEKKNKEWIHKFIKCPSYLNEGVTGFLSVAVAKENECTKACKGHHLIYFKRRLCYLECAIKMYPEKIKALKMEKSKCTTDACRWKIDAKINEYKDKITKSLAQIKRYKESGFLKNAYVNVWKDKITQMD